MTREVRYAVRAALAAHWRQMAPQDRIAANNALTPVVRALSHRQRSVSAAHRKTPTAGSWFASWLTRQRGRP